MKDQLLNFILKDLFKAVTEEEILTFYRGKFYVGKNELPDNDVQDLVSGARVMRDLFTYKLLMNELKKIAQDRMVTESHNYEDIYFGKAMLYCIDVLDKKVNNLANMETKKVVKKDKK